MQKSIIRLNIENELDVVLAYRRAIQLSEFTGMPLSAQTKFATAVSEICRNVVEHVGQGSIEFRLIEVKGQLHLEAVISDKGRGIPNVNELLAKRIVSGYGKGQGIYNSRKLVDSFSIDTEPEKGTKVYLQRRLSGSQPAITNAVIQSWKDHFLTETSISPYAELKRQNAQLIELLDQLRLQNMEAEQQMTEISRLNQELEAANKSLDSFAYTVSHDLKAPLRNLEGLTHAITNSLEEQDLPDARQCASLLQEQIGKMDTFIGGILSTARFGIGSQRQQLIRPSEFIAQVIRSIKVPPSFTVTVQPDIPEMLVEEVPLSQIFINLVSNAINHHDQPTGTIDISCVLQGQMAQFCVADNGPGVAHSNQHDIFNPYVTTITAPSQSTGLGLSIVKRIVENKGGRVWVKSEGRGSSFCFTWPAGAPPSEAADDI